MVAPQPVPPTHARHHRSDPPPRLIVADATVALVERWKTELTVLRRRSPKSDAVRALTDCIHELVDAINAGHTLTVQLTIAEARAVSHIPVSTLRWLCKNKPTLIGARKREGIWYIDRMEFQRYLASHAGASHDNASPIDSLKPVPADKSSLAVAEARPDLRLELR